MANLESAKKRARQNEARRSRNRARRAALKSATRTLSDKLHAGDAAAAADLLKKMYKQIDQTAAKGTLHRNTAARRKSRLAHRLNAAKTTAKS